MLEMRRNPVFLPAMLGIEAGMRWNSTVSGMGPFEQALFVKGRRSNVAYASSDLCLLSPNADLIDQSSSKSSSRSRLRMTPWCTSSKVIGSSAAMPVKVIPSKSPLPWPTYLRAVPRPPVIMKTK